MNTSIIILLVAYQIKHWLADYPLQTQYMLKKGGEGWSWILPLTAHASVHALGTLIIAATATSLANLDHSLSFVISLAALDFVIHFTMDRIKADKKLLGRFPFPTTAFFCSLGFDQAVHHLTHYLIIYLLVN